MYFLVSPGAHFGYHALTFGLYVDELIQRADPQHRDTATIFKHMIAEPFGKFICIYINNNKSLEMFYIQCLCVGTYNMVLAVSAVLCLCGLLCNI